MFIFCNKSIFNSLNQYRCNIFFLQKCMCLKLVNYDWKILELEQPIVAQFFNVTRYSGLVRLCFVVCMTINHNMQTTFAKKQHLEKTFFKLPIGEMTITLDDISCRLHLSIRIISHGRTDREEDIEMMVTYFRDGPTKASKKVADTRCARERFIFYFWKNLYKDYMQWAQDVKGDDLQVDYHRTCVLRCYLLFFVGTSMFMDKNST